MKKYYLTPLILITFFLAVAGKNNCLAPALITNFVLQLNDEEAIKNIIQQETDAYVKRDSSRLFSFYSTDSITQSAWNNPDGTFGYDTAFKSESGYLEDEIKEWLNTNSFHNEKEKKNFISLLKKEGMAPEAYELIVHADSIDITASAGAGIFYGIQSLKSLLTADIWRTKHDAITIPCVEVKDEPRYRLGDVCLYTTHIC